MSEQPGTYGTAYLPLDIARCEGFGNFDDITGEMRWHWREGCDTCLRRLAPVPAGVDVMQIKPPAIIAFWCPFYLGPDPGREP